MKRRSILERQSVKKRSPNGLSRFWKLVRVFTSISFKVSLLFIGMISLSLLFLYLYQYLITSPQIKLEQVIIKGVDEDIKRELMDLSGLNSDQSLLTVNLNGIKEKIEEHPWVRTADLEKKFPHTLIIRVEKEIPRALVSLDGLFFVNRWGKIFKEAELWDDKDYPIITGIPLTGEKRDEALKTASLVLDLLESETGTWSLKELSEIHINKDGNISLYSLSLPAVIKMGQGELEVKKEELKKIIAHLNKTGNIHMVKAIDLNYRGGAVVSFKNAG